MQKSINKLFFMVCASLFIANLQAMDGSNVEELKKMSEKESSQVEQLRENAQDEDNASCLENRLSRISYVYLPASLVGICSGPIPFTLLILGMTAVEAEIYIKQNAAAAKNPVEEIPAEKAVEAK